LPKEGNLQFGLECSLLLGFKFDKINYLYLGGNGAYVSLSTSMWMFDLAGGAYANLLLGEDDRIRIYAGAGPLMTYAAYSADKNYSDSTTDENYNESAFGVGVYARTGIEIRIHYRGLVGLGARWNWASVDFTEVGGSSDLVGVAGFITYTAGF
ncbi:MAG: hypothetical protein OES84_03220, partial [Kiritimatiellaceae bacterium]|nr:hypothetical protein [Kiritimatiellaceae bacterium]